jgi:3-methyladenine DNA glycosylase/8-oxoguanine DNA glycosylase
VSAGKVATRSLAVTAPFDLARTTAPVWWARGRWPSVDWRAGALTWVGWEDGRVAWRSVRQLESGDLEMSGDAAARLDEEWASRVLGLTSECPAFADPVLCELALRHAGIRAWAAGSLYEGFVAAIVGQSISVAAAAVTERRLSALFHPGVAIGDRLYWPPPRPDQLAEADATLLRGSGVTLVRVEALRAIGAHFSESNITTDDGDPIVSRETAERLLAVRGVGRWTVESALLWGVGHPDAHPSGDVALLRAAKPHYPGVATLSDLDRLAEAWRPHRAWAARLLWLDLLGHAEVANSDAGRDP